MPIPKRDAYEKPVLKADDPLKVAGGSRPGYDIHGKAIYQEGAFSVYPKRRNDLMMNMEPKEAKYFHYMVTRHGMSENHALGMLANIKREVAELDPKKPSGDKGGGPGGLFQWSKSSGRQTPEVAKMVKAGDWQAQIDYAIYEEDVYGKPGAYLRQDFKSAEEAEKWWRENWENPSAKNAADIGKEHLDRYKKGVGEVYRMDNPLGPPPSKGSY
tara:strand:- start:84 stop:725 length:642 start_codon:yes stop_codon:yes gene_type:complete